MDGEKMNSEFTVAVHALVFLNHKAKMVSSEELAANICTHPSRVRKILAKLKTAGLVFTKEGQEGGYYVTFQPKHVTLQDIGKAIEAQYVSIPWHSGDEEMDCLIASGMEGIMDGILEDLNVACKERLSNKTIADIDQQIFGKHD